MMQKIGKSTVATIALVKLINWTYKRDEIAAAYRKHTAKVTLEQGGLRIAL